MSVLKDKFENYTPQPDSKVWQGIEASLRKGMVRRRWLTASSVVAVGTGVVALFMALNKGEAPNVAVDRGEVIVAENSHEDVSLNENASNELVTISTHEQNSSSSVVTRDFSSPQAETEVAEKEESVSVIKEEAKEEVVQPVVAGNVSEPVKAESKPSTTTAPKSTPSVQMESKVAETSATEQEPKRRIDPRVSTPAELAVWVPNAFSPDDPTEESARVFKVFPNDDASIRTFEIYIYSRTGRLVYHSKDYTQGWDGTANGHPQPMGTYVYIIELNDAAKGLQHKKGTITLIR